MLIDPASVVVDGLPSRTGDLIVGICRQNSRDSDRLHSCKYSVDEGKRVRIHLGHRNLIPKKRRTVLCSIGDSRVIQLARVSLGFGISRKTRPALIDTRRCAAKVSVELSLSRNQDIRRPRLGVVRSLGPDFEECFVPAVVEMWNPDWPTHLASEGIQVVGGLRRGKVWLSIKTVTAQKLPSRAVI